MKKQYIYILPIVGKPCENWRSLPLLEIYYHFNAIQVSPCFIIKLLNYPYLKEHTAIGIKKGNSTEFMRVMAVLIQHTASVA